MRRRRQLRRLRARGPAPRLLAAKLGTTHSAPPAWLLPLRASLTPRPPSPLPQAGSPPQAPQVGGGSPAGLAGGRCGRGTSPDLPQDPGGTQKSGFWPTRLPHAPIQIPRTEFRSRLETIWCSQKLDGLRDRADEPRKSSFPRFLRGSGQGPSQGSATIGGLGDQPKVPLGEQV